MDKPCTHVSSYVLTHFSHRILVLRPSPDGFCEDGRSRTRRGRLTRVHGECQSHSWQNPVLKIAVLVWWCTVSPTADRPETTEKAGWTFKSHGSTNCEEAQGWFSGHCKESIYRIRKSPERRCGRRGAEEGWNRLPEESRQVRAGDEIHFYSDSHIAQ